MNTERERQRRMSLDLEAPSSDGLGGRKLFGAFLRSLRAYTGASQAYFAGRADISVSTWTRMEDGRQSIPSRGNVERISEAGGLDTMQTRRLMVSAGYLPTLPWQLSQEDIEVLAAALGELVADPKHDKGAIEAFRLRAKIIRDQGSQ